MEGACEGKRKASEERQTRATRKGTVFLRFPPWRESGAPRSLRACLRLPEKREKITPVMQARFMVNVVRISQRFLLQMNLQCGPYCCSPKKRRQNLFWDFNRCVLFQNNQNLQELYIGNNQLTNIREIFNLKVKDIYPNLCLAGFL